VISAPSHGGKAPGLLLHCSCCYATDNLHEVALFSMNQRAEDLMIGTLFGRLAEAAP
jgi:aspartyl-tRNA synthetase